jgi:hypothetical protein
VTSCRHYPSHEVFQVKFQALFLVVLMGGLLSACTFERKEGNGKLAPGAVAAIQKGVTTKDQVRALLGPPQSMKTQVPVLQPPGLAPLPAKQTASELWAFWNSSDRKPLVALPFIAAKPHHASYTVIIFFDAQGVVLDYDIEDAHS